VATGVDDSVVVVAQEAIDRRRTGISARVMVDEW
jgi:hypothetical protein